MANTREEVKVIQIRERKLNLIKLRKKFDKWHFHKTAVFKQTVLSFLFFILALALGVYLYLWGESDPSLSFAKNVVSVILFAGGSLGTLAKSLFSVEELFLYFKEIDDELAEKFDDETIESSLKSEPPTKDPKDSKISKVLDFLKELIRNIRRMSIIRTIFASIMSCAFLVMTIISIFFLTYSPNEYLFSCMVIILISFSSYCLYMSLLVMIIIKWFLPWAEKREFDNVVEESVIARSENNYFRKTIPLKNFFSKKEITRNLLLVLFLPLLAIIGLVTLKFELKRIDLSKQELSCIERLLFGVPMVHDDNLDGQYNNKKQSNTVNDNTNKQSNTANDTRIDVTTTTETTAES
ncbi:1555_t:CDS:1 [Ambispora leptoticha]|uniref:1555_t:CDS:1 n=1 Tax=Ambispora leptoticha TaxID=144679 RepID=A0A9N9E5Z6_9GLOM|nr:1555_t:CDS:1 [Ambispora leptoticha]